MASKGAREHFAVLEKRSRIPHLHHAANDARWRLEPEMQFAAMLNSRYNFQLICRRSLDTKLFVAG
jgi:hypothetical protein